MLYTASKNRIRTAIVCSVLCLTFIDYSGFGYYYFLICVPFLLQRLPHFYFNNNFFLILLWGGTYALSSMLFSKTISYGGSLQFLINYPLIYIAGKYIYKNCIIPKSYFIFILIVCISIIAVISVLKDISINGFAVVGMGRNIPLIGIDNAEGYIAATGISTRLLLPISLVGLFFLKQETNIIKKIAISYGGVALFCAVRIQSRTAVVLFSLILIFCLIVNFQSKNIKSVIASVMSLAILSLILYYIIDTYSEQLVIIERFENESNTDGGGRLERLLCVLHNMWKYPFGGMSLNRSIEYAHNFWVDCGRVSGLIPMSLLLIITLRYLKILHGFNLKSKDALLNALCNLGTIAILIGFCSEPILEGVPMLAAFFMLLFGFIDASKPYST